MEKDGEIYEIEMKQSASYENVNFFDGDEENVEEEIVVEEEYDEETYDELKAAFAKDKSVSFRKGCRMRSGTADDALAEHVIDDCLVGLQRNALAVGERLAASV